ncbi:hypothetical protein FF38_02987 [Lucilia cuprina]|uniref:Uncharacterized protein n=1 Tax=Lucilia cuprina TaxID=7375 RepID=A0A0L0CMT3_LUCCU|nr:hypothetical protein FF38_02987 [Lucilia cuprina]
MMENFNEQQFQSYLPLQINVYMILAASLDDDDDDGVADEFIEQFIYVECYFFNMIQTLVMDNQSTKDKQTNLSADKMIYMQVILITEVAVIIMLFCCKELCLSESLVYFKSVIKQINPQHFLNYLKLLLLLLSVFQSVNHECLKANLLVLNSGGSAVLQRPMCI